MFLLSVQCAYDISETPSWTLSDTTSVVVIKIQGMDAITAVVLDNKQYFGGRGRGLGWVVNGYFSL